MFENVEPIAGPASRPPATFCEYDPRYPAVAKLVADAVERHLPECSVEHVGSTAIPGCPGKGIVDLVLLYPEGCLEPAKALLKALGFQEQGAEFLHPWPESRPMRMGTVTYDGESFAVYVHVVAEHVHEASRFRLFRDRLIRDPELAREYVERKRELVERGVTDADEYTERKRPVIERILGDDY